MVAHQFLALLVWVRILARQQMAQLPADRLFCRQFLLYRKIWIVGLVRIADTQLISEKTKFYTDRYRIKNYSVTLQPYYKQYCFNFAKQKQSMILVLNSLPK
jgi:hypothetical protein